MDGIAYATAIAITVNFTGAGPGPVKPPTIHFNGGFVAQSTATPIQPKSLPVPPRSKVESK